MKNHNIDKLADDEYYHGTMPYKALQILYEGFRLKKIHSWYGSGGTFKQGLYLTKSLSSAKYFGPDYIFKCRLKKGVSIVWIDKGYDKKVINYLKREFSKAILMGPVSKAIPRNKHLTRNELIHLLNYRFIKADFWAWKDSKKWNNWYNSISSFRQQLQLHKYDGIGELESLDGLVIFNPSFVKQIGLFKVSGDYENPFLQEMDKKRFILDIDKCYKEKEEDLDNEEKKELDNEEKKDWEYIRTLQGRFCRENGLS